jgi:hypothetical protein
MFLVFLACLSLSWSWSILVLAFLPIGRLVIALSCVLYLSLSVCLGLRRANVCFGIVSALFLFLSSDWLVLQFPCLVIVLRLSYNCLVTVIVL